MKHQLTNSKTIKPTPMREGERRFPAIHVRRNKTRRASLENWHFSRTFNPSTALDATFARA